MSYDDDVFINPPQLDGHIDLESANSPTSSNRNDPMKDLADVIAKVRAKTQPPNKTIELKKLPPLNTKFRLTDGIKKKSINPTTPKKSLSTPTIIDRTKEQSKKMTPHLLPSLKRNNEDTIRPFDTRLSLTHSNIQVNIKIN
jgi:hypothetical protein